MKTLLLWCFLLLSLKAPAQSDSSYARPREVMLQDSLDTERLWAKRQLQDNKRLTDQNNRLMDKTARFWGFLVLISIGLGIRATL